MFRKWSFGSKICLGFGILVLGFTALAVVGCGSKSENTSYFYSPGWTRAGNIVFSQGLQSVSRDIIGNQSGSSYNESVMTMDKTGANATFLFDTTAAPAYAKSCSPNADYLGYLTDLRNNTFGKLVIQNIASGTHHGLEQVEMVFSPAILAFDWSDTGNQIVYCTTNEVHVRNWEDYTGATDATVVTAADITFVSWQQGKRIAFVHDGLLSLIYADGSGRVDLSAVVSVDKPQISSSNTNEVYGIAGTDYCLVDVNAKTRTAKFASFKGDLPRLSPDAKKVLYDKTGATSGIYLLDATSWVESAVK